MQLGFASAILPDLKLEQVLTTASQIGYDCIELMCWPVGRAERRYAGVTHIDVDQLNQQTATEIQQQFQQAGVSISGLFDLAPLIKTSMNRNLGLDAAGARANSPLFMTPAGDAPLLLLVGGDESAGFRDQSDRLADAWGSRCRRLDSPGQNHFSVVEDMADPHSALFAAMKAMILGDQER